MLLITACGLTRADTITLTDGTKLEGKAIKQGDQYWVKTTDGESRMIAADKVQSVNRSEAAAPGAGIGAPSAPRAGMSPDYLAARKSADLTVFALEAAHIWQVFIKTHPDSSDLSLARAELERWTGMKDAEKIRGRWMAGVERAAVLEHANALGKQGMEDLKANRTLQAIDKFKEAVKVYPNDYTANYSLGYLFLQARQNEESISFFEQALRVRPESFNAMNNLAVAFWETKKYEGAMALFVRAAQAGDSPLLARNLMSALVLTPKDQVSITRYKEAVAASGLLAAKYQLQPAEDPKTIKFWLQPPPQPVEAISGSGFAVSSDGLILTNRHVAGFGSKITVRTSDGKNSPAEVVKIDTEQDLALIRITGSGNRPPYLHFSKGDLPNEGAQCFALGFPLIDRMGASLKITQGIVSGLRPAEAADILIDAKVNPGNSGGPLVDKHGEVIGIVTQKSRSSDMEDSYGIAVSAGKIRQFLSKNSITLATAEPETATLLAEDIVAKAKSAIVCIIVQRGGTTSTTRPANTPPGSGSSGSSSGSSSTSPMRGQGSGTPDMPAANNAPNANRAMSGWGPTDDSKRVVDLVPLFENNAKYVVRGTWRVSDGKLFCDSKGLCPRIGVPYKLPEEYDLRIEWSQPTLRNGVFVGLSQNGHGFDFGVETVAGRPGGFTAIFGRDVNDSKNTTRFVSNGLEREEHYTMLVQVRRNSVTGYLNGEMKATYKTTDFAEFTPGPFRQVKDESICYIGCDDPTVFYRVELVEITGTGKPL